MEGFINVHRKLLNNPISTNIELMGLLMYLLLRCSHKEKSFYLGMQKLTVKPGQFISSLKQMSIETGLSRSKVTRLISVLQSEGILNIKTYSKYSLIELINWSRYQKVEHQMNIKGTSNEHQMDTINNIYLNNLSVPSELDSKILTDFVKADQKNENPEKKEEKTNQEAIFIDPFEEMIQDSAGDTPPETPRKPNIKAVIDGMIRDLKKKCDAWKIVYDPKDERRFAYHMLSENWIELASKHGFSSGINFALAILDMSMDTDSRRRFKCNGFKIIYQSYAKIIADFQSNQEKKNKPAKKTAGSY